MKIKLFRKISNCAITLIFVSNLFFRSVYNTPIDITQYMSVVREDGSDKIIGATAIQMTWIGKVNLSDSDASAASGLPVKFKFSNIDSIDLKFSFRLTKAIWNLSC